MKKYLFPLLLFILVACSTTTDINDPKETSTATDTKSQIDKQSEDTETSLATEQKTSTIFEEEALDIAKTIIEQLKSTIQSVGPQYEGDEDYTSDKPDISPYATAQYIDNYLNDDFFNCEAEDCPIIKTPQDIYFGWNPTNRNKNYKTYTR